MHEGHISNLIVSSPPKLSPGSSAPCVGHYLTSSISVMDTGEQASFHIVHLTNLLLQPPVTADTPSVSLSH